jgi:uncharacterized Zn finger protein
MRVFNFDLDVFRERLGEKAFLRHKNYLNGEVEVAGIDAGRLLAWVHGSGDTPYLVEVGDDDFAFCSCPAFEEGGVCKHLPAVAHIANELSIDQIRGLARRFDRLRESLSFETKDALAEQLVTLAKRVPGVLEALEGDEVEP